MKDGSFVILTHRLPDGRYRLINPVLRTQMLEAIDVLKTVWSGEVVLVTRRAGGPGVDPQPSISAGFCRRSGAIESRSRHVLVASLFIQLFALITPLFFQVVIDKVLRAQGHVDPGRDRGRAACHRPVRRHPAISALLRAQSHNEPDRRRTRARGCSTICCACRSAISRRARPARRWPAMRELETVRSISHRPGPVLGDRSRIRDRVHCR